MYELITPEQAVELLARRRVASEAVGGLAKQADWGETAFGKDPIMGTLRNTGIGAGVGAGLGGLLGYARSSGDDDWGDILRGAAQGGTVGGALGGGATALYHGANLLGEGAGKDKITQDKEKKRAAKVPLTTGERATRMAAGGGIGYGGGLGIRALIDRLTRYGRAVTESDVPKLHAALLNAQEVQTGARPGRAAIDAAHIQAARMMDEAQGMGWFGKLRAVLFGGTKLAPGGVLRQLPKAKLPGLAGTVVRHAPLIGLGVGLGAGAFTDPTEAANAEAQAAQR